MRSVALVFDATERGAIFLTDLELLRTDMTHAEHPKSDTPKPEYVTDLEAAYGAPSQAGFGSAVFYERLQGKLTILNRPRSPSTSTSSAICGSASAMTRGWGRGRRSTPARPDAERDIIVELRGITNRDARSVSADDPRQHRRCGEARAALSAAFDDSAVTELVVYNMGDGGAMSGLLVAGRRGKTGESTFLVFLLD